MKKIFIHSVLIKRIISSTALYLTFLVAIANQSTDSIHGQTSTDKHSNYELDLKKGERLFNGLIRKNEGAVNCAGCHNIYPIDTLNWNPSAIEIALSSINMDTSQFTNALLMPMSSTRIMEAHEGINLSEEEILLVRNYLNHLLVAGEPESKPKALRTILFVLAILLINIAFVDLVFTKKIKFRFIHILILIAGNIYVFSEIAQAALKFDQTKNYAPLQPIKFSHQVHAGQNKTDCQFCHYSAEHSKTAGIPEMNVCYNCHILVREGTRSGKFEINKIIKAMEDSIPVHWIRIHKLPDHVFFSHAQHVGAGKLDCTECHGKPEEMDVLRQENTLGMGWCLNCHKTRKVQFIENEYYGHTFKEYHEKIVNHELDSITVEQIGGTNCMKCHY